MASWLNQRNAAMGGFLAMVLLDHWLVLSPLTRQIALGLYALGSLGYLAPAALGVGVLLSTVPRAYDALRIAGASYLGYLAWKAVFSAGWTNLDARPLKREGHAKVGRVRWSGSSIQRRRSSTSRSFPNSSIPRAEAYQRKLLCLERRTSS